MQAAISTISPQKTRRVLTSLKELCSSLRIPESQSKFLVEQTMFLFNKCLSIFLAIQSHRFKSKSPSILSDDDRLMMLGNEEYSEDNIISINPSNTQTDIQSRKRTHQLSEFPPSPDRFQHTRDATFTLYMAACFFIICRQSRSIVQPSISLSSNLSGVLDPKSSSLSPENTTPNLPITISELCKHLNPPLVPSAVFSVADAILHCHRHADSILYNIEHSEIDPLSLQTVHSFLNRFLSASPSDFVERVVLQFPNNFSNFRPILDIMNNIYSSLTSASTLSTFNS
jgi:hypothetical protein